MKSSNQKRDSLGLLDVLLLVLLCMFENADHQIGSGRIKFLDYLVFVVMKRA